MKSRKDIIEKIENEIEDIDKAIFIGCLSGHLLSKYTVKKLKLLKLISELRQGETK